MASPGIALPAVTLSEAQAYVRIETGEEEAVVAGLIRTASALCEAFIQQVVIARDFTEDLAATGTWERLALTPVRSISEVQAVDSAGAATPLAVGDYAIDMDSSGDGWVRITNGSLATRVRVTGTAGMADSENEVPEPIRQGALLTRRCRPPIDGMTAYVRSTSVWAVYRGSAWELGVLRGSALNIAGQQVVGARGAAIDTPAGGTTVDVEGRASISAILAALRLHGLIAP